MNEHVRVDVSGSVATATFDRPGARNAMTWEMYEALVAFCDRVDDDPDVRAVVLRGAGTAFVAGTDIAQFREFDGPDDGIAYERRIDAVLDRLESVRVPTIAAVDGYATGGGLAIAGACDLRICTPRARFGVPIARTVGNCLSMSTYARLADLMGSARTLHLIYTAEFLDAEQALRVGLASEVVGEDELDQRLSTLCQRLLEHAPLTMQTSKQALARLRRHRVPPAEDLISLCYGSEDFREGVQAFLDRRPPRWKAR